MPRADELPPALQGFQQRNAVAIDDARFAQDFDNLVDAIFGRPRGFARRELDRLQRFDLPIALGILAATGRLPSNKLDSHEFAGELALTGDLRSIRGALVMTLKAHHEGRAFVLPEASAHEAALVRAAVVHPAKNLLAVCAHLAGRDTLSRCPVVESSPEWREHPDLSDVRGQSLAKRALQVAAAGEHSLLIL